jgi:hypothetical protein
MRNVPHRRDWVDARNRKGDKRRISMKLWIAPDKAIKVTTTHFPQWPLQCQANKRQRGLPEADRVQCSRMAYPGGQFCWTHDRRSRNLVQATRRYLMWVLAGTPTLGATPITELITIEAVIKSVLQRQHPHLTDKDRLDAATLLLRVLEWTERGRSKWDPHRALVREGFTDEDAQRAHVALWKAGWLPDPSL